MGSPSKCLSLHGTAIDLERLQSEAIDSSVLEVAKRHLAEYQADLQSIEEQVKAAYAEQFTADAQESQAETSINRFNQTQRGSYTPDTNTITLTEQADLSTFLHESGHMFLELQMRMISQLMQEDALVGTSEMQKQLIKDTETLLQWFGLERIEDWFNLDFEAKRAHHEKFAESFEVYLFEGKAPSLALQRLFSTFRQWLRKVYEHAKSYLDDAQLSDEVRQVFDRMLATDEEIKRVNQARSLMPLFESPETSGMTPDAFAAYQAAHDAQTDEAMETLALKGVKDMQWLGNAKNRTLKKLQKQHDEARRMVRAQVRFDVMSQPGYRAWSFLTGKIAPEDRVKSFEALKNNPNAVQEDRDSLFTAIAKLGGLDYEEVSSTWAYDQPGRAKMPVFGKPVVRKTGGLSLENMAERLLQHGYLTPDANGKHDLREFEDKFDAELRGDFQYSVQFDGGDWYGKDAVAGSHVVNPSALKNGRFDIDALKSMDLPNTVLSALVSRGMTANQGFHPDVLSDVLPGFDSGDALARTMADIEPPNEVIERLTDERMLIEHAELSSPDAIERAANEAVSNAAHTRFLKTEIEALDKATGKKSVLSQTADMMARQIIDRLKIRDLKPHLYARAEARAAKAAKDYLKKGRREQAAAEKRNQLLNNFAAKYAFEAEDELDKWLKYFKGFYKNTNKADPLDIEDLNFILALLDKYDFKWISNRRLSDNLKIRDWVQSRIASGEPIPYLSEAILSGPELAAYLRGIEVRDANGELIYADEIEQTKRLADAIDASQRKYYKEATIEEMRGLYDTIQALETAARLRQKAFTSDKNETIAQIQQDLSASIAEYGGKGGKNVGHKTDWFGSKWQSVQGFTANHVKVPMWARIMDGGQDGGPVWRYIVKPANDRANLESRMKSEVTAKLDAILRPITDKASISDKAFKGRVIPGLGFSMTWQERFAVALNVGNESNYQRLEGGGIAGKRETLSPREIQAILSTLTADELMSVQAIWDLIESYKPLIQEQLKRMNQREPVWITPRPIHITSADGQDVRLRGGYFPVVFDTRASTQAKANDKASTLKEAMQAANNQATTRRSFLKERVQAVKRPLLLSQQSIYSGINDVIHSLAWQEWLMDVNRFLKAGGATDKAILEYYGADVRDVFHDWRDDIVLGQRRMDHVLERAAGFLRRNVSLAAMAFNVNTALLQPLGLFNSGARIGWGWLGRGLERYIEDPIEATQEARRLSPFLQNRMLNRFRDLNELQTMVSSDSRYDQMLGQYGFWLMVQAQSVADVPTWWGAYYQAMERDPLDESLAIALADQAVKDSQGGGEDVDLSGMERGGALLKLFTAFYSYMATTTSLSYGQIKINANKKQAQRQNAKTAVNLLLVLGVAPQLGWMLKEALQPGGDDDDELLPKMIKEELAFLFGLVVLGREVGSMISAGLHNYHGPPGFRMLVDSFQLAEQSQQGEFDTAFRKAFINTLGDFTGIPSAQINKSITGIEALYEGNTQNPSAVALGFKSN
jgi:hypothetical protein